MTDRRSHPPKGALWLLRHAYFGKNEALEGDLLERFREKQSAIWIWRQVFIAITLGTLSAFRERWPEVCYAIIGVAIPLAFEKRIYPSGFRFWLVWWRLPWPFSQLVMELSASFLMALAAAPFLAVGLVIAQRFRWTYILRTAGINLTLITLVHYSFDYLSPWITRPVPGYPHQRMIIIPGALQLLAFFLMFFVAAWLGSRGRRHLTQKSGQSA